MLDDAFDPASLTMTLRIIWSRLKEAMSLDGLGHHHHHHRRRRRRRRYRPCSIRMLTLRSLTARSINTDRLAERHRHWGS
jgi:hypothetical protein